MIAELPGDCTLLALASGALLVSREYATFCRIPPQDVDAVRDVLQEHSPATVLPSELYAALEKHGFFAGPRPAEAHVPTVQLQVTNACNLRCSYCCTDSGNPRPTELDLETFRSVAEQIHRAFGSGARVALMGGEPFIVPWAMDLAEHIVELGLQLVAYTNGVDVPGAVLDRLAALAERGAELHVSLAGPTPALCDAESGAPRFAAALGTVQALADRNAPCIVDLMLIPEHVAAIAQHVRHLVRRLPPTTSFTLGLLYRGGREAGQHLFASFAELDAALDHIAFSGGQIVPAIRQRVPLAYRREGCDCALGHSLNVRSDGKLYSCFRMEECIGDLREQRFDELVKRLRQAPARAASLSVCRECALNTLCGGGCRSENLLYTGDANRPLCDTWRVRVLSELLAEDRVDAVEWPVAHLLAEARARGLPAPPLLIPRRASPSWRT